VTSVAETTEAERVEEWRRDFFADLGFTPRQALALMLSATDPHTVEKLLAGGCTHELALKIVL
jgi:hypothetical protein